MRVLERPTPVLVALLPYQIDRFGHAVVGRDAGPHQCDPEGHGPGQLELDRLRAARHLLECDVCARLSEPLIGRGRAREDEVRVLVRADADIVAARQAARALAERLGFPATDLTLIATADNAWGLAGWGGACGGIGGCSVTMNADTSVSATFMPLFMPVEAPIIGLPTDLPGLPPPIIGP